MPKRFDIEQFNRILKEHNQQLQAEKITGKKVVLSNGLTLQTEKEVSLCKRRVMCGDSVWKENFDDLYSTDSNVRKVTQQYCRSATSSQGGISCQKKYNKKIKNNLNTGIPWNKGEKLHYDFWNKGKTKHNDERIRKISEGRTGEKNWLFGKKYSDDDKAKQSKKMKDLILSGKFTPNSNNRNTHWDSSYKNKKYRSSWEALYHYFDNDAEYESLRIFYKFENKDYIYIMDFVNHKTKTAIEVKPRELVSDKKTQAKISAAKKWCDNAGYTFVLADKEYFLSKSMPVDLTEFDSKTQNKIRNLYEAG
jgi:hypothetical protein